MMTLNVWMPCKGCTNAAGGVLNGQTNLCTVGQTNLRTVAEATGRDEPKGIQRDDGAWFILFRMHPLSDQLRPFSV